MAPLLRLLMFSKLICCRMWSVLSSGPPEDAILVNCSISRLFSRSNPQTSSCKFGAKFDSSVELKSFLLKLPEWRGCFWQLSSCSWCHREAGGWGRPADSTPPSPPSLWRPGHEPAYDNDRDCGGDRVWRRRCHPRMRTSPCRGSLSAGRWCWPSCTSQPGPRSSAKHLAGNPCWADQQLSWWSLTFWFSRGYGIARHYRSGFLLPGLWANAAKIPKKMIHECFYPASQQINLPFTFNFATFVAALMAAVETSAMSLVESTHSFRRWPSLAYLDCRKCISFHDTYAICVRLLPFMELVYRGSQVGQ